MAVLRHAANRRAKQVNRKTNSFGGVKYMLSKCANPSCSNEFRYFGEGKVFEIRSERISVTAHKSYEAAAYKGHDKNRKRVEHFWLCAECYAKFTIATDLKHNVQVIPRLSGKSERAIA